MLQGSSGCGRGPNASTGRRTPMEGIEGITDWLKRRPRNAVVAEHVHDIAVTSSRLPDTRHRVQHIGFGVEQALNRDPRGWVRSGPRTARAWVPGWLARKRCQTRWDFPRDRPLSSPRVRSRYSMILRHLQAPSAAVRDHSIQSTNCAPRPWHSR